MYEIALCAVTEPGWGGGGKGEDLDVVVGGGGGSVVGGAFRIVSSSDL